MAIPHRPQSVWQLSYHKDEIEVSPFVVTTVGWVLLGVSLLNLVIDCISVLRFPTFWTFADFNGLISVGALAVNCLGVLAGTFCVRKGSPITLPAIVWAWCRIGLAVLIFADGLYRSRLTLFFAYQGAGSMYQAVHAATLPALLLMLFWNLGSRRAARARLYTPANSPEAQSRHLQRIASIVRSIGIVILMQEIVAIGVYAFTIYIYIQSPPQDLRDFTPLRVYTYGVIIVSTAVCLLGVIVGVEMIRQSPRGEVMGVFWARLRLAYTLLRLCLLPWLYLSVYPKIHYRVVGYTVATHICQMIVATWLAVLLLLLFRHPDFRTASPGNLNDPVL